MKNPNALIITAMLVAYTATAEPEISGTPTELRRHLDAIPGQVVISATAERTVEADRAVVQVSVVTSERRLKTSLEKNNSIRTDIVSKLSAGGIDEDRIHTSRFSSTPVHSSWTGKVKEYEIESKVRVHAESEKEIHLIAGLVDELDEVSLASLTFEMSKKEEITVDLLKEAFQRVQARKELYESSLGVSLRPRRVGLPPVEDASLHDRRMRKGDRAVLSVASVLTNPELSMVLHSLGQEQAGMNQFEELVFKAEITVTYDLVPGEGK